MEYFNPNQGSYGVTQFTDDAGSPITGKRFTRDSIAFVFCRTSDQMGQILAYDINEVQPTPRHQFNLEALEAAKQAF